MQKALVFVLDDTEHLFEAEAMLTEECVREIIKTVLHALHSIVEHLYWSYLAYQGRHSHSGYMSPSRRRGETETLEASFTQWKEDPC